MAAPRDSAQDTEMIPGETADEGCCKMEAVFPTDHAVDLFPPAMASPLPSPSQDLRQGKARSSAAAAAAAAPDGSTTSGYRLPRNHAKDCSYPYNPPSQASSNDTGSLDLLYNDLYLSTEQVETSVDSEASYSLFEDTIPEPSQLNTAPSRVMITLDRILRERVDVELEQFRASMHNLLTQQHTDLQQLLSLSQAPSNQLTDQSESIEFPHMVEKDSIGVPLKTTHYGTEMDSECTETRPTENGKDQGDVRDKCLIHLFTSASIISKTLRSKEFNLH